MPSDEIVSRLDAHCRRLIQSEVLPWISEDPKQGEIYAVGLARFGEEEYDPRLVGTG